MSREFGYDYDWPLSLQCDWHWTVDKLVYWFSWKVMIWPVIIVEDALQIAYTEFYEYELSDIYVWMTWRRIRGKPMPQQNQ